MTERLDEILTPSKKRGLRMTERLDEILTPSRSEA
jgi:hypothetical protein